MGISIHAPREGGDAILGTLDFIKDIFQSTPPARGATVADQMQDQSSSISIHAPREGGDYISRFGA